MRGVLLTAVVLTVIGGAASLSTQGQAYDVWFTDGTMRVDYVHSGGLGQEILALDRVVNDGSWAGSRARLLDELNLGQYFFEVVDRATNRTIYSRGFSSIYGEWETTAEAQKVHRSFTESLRFPWPKAPVQVVLEKRDSENVFREIWSTTVDPGSRFVNPVPPPKAGTVWTLFENGPPSEKVDILLIGEGYTAAQTPKFHADARRLVDALFAVEPFKRRKHEFNVRGLDLPSEQPGVNRPQVGSFRRTPLSTEYNIFDSERYLLTLDNRTLRDVAASAPYEFLEILVNEQQYGGGGVFNDQATAAVDTSFAEYVFIHEFGHHFAGLADEYYTSDVATETGPTDGPEPWEPNITALHDAARIKWKELIDTGTPLPTPWAKDEYEAKNRAFQAKRRELLAQHVPEADVDRLFREQMAWEGPFLASMKYSGKVGAFEGAAYEAKGLYRSEADCIMFTRDLVGFCRACRRAINRIIDLYALP